MSSENEIKQIAKQVVDVLTSDGEQIFQYPNKPVPESTDLLVVSSESESHKTVNSTLQQLFDVIAINADQVVNTAITEADTTDILPEGLNNKYLTSDGGATDNLVGTPNFDDLKTETDNHIADVTNPHQTTFQQAYSQSPNVVLNNGDIKFTNSTTGVVEAVITNSKGSQFHAPVYHLSNGQSLTLDSDSIDTLYSNDQTTSGTNSINLQLESSQIYASNATFFAWNNGIGSLTVQAPPGVTIDGIDAATINLTQDQYIKFIRLSSDTWVSLTTTADQVVLSWDGSTTPVDIIAGSGVDITGGVISLTGTGATAGYGSCIVRQPVVPALSWTDNSWKIISLPMTIDKVENNVTIGNDSYGTFIQNSGVSPAQLAMPVTFYMCRYSNATPCWYYLSPYISADGVSAPTIYHGANDIVVFSLRFQNSGISTNDGLVPIVYSNSVLVPAGGKIYFAIQNMGSTTAANNDLTINNSSFLVSKLGDVGGTSSGVNSLNGLGGNVSTIQGNRTLITVSAGAITFDYLGSKTGLLSDTPSTDYNIPNPCANIVSLTPQSSGLKFKLPVVISVGATDLLNVGDSFILINQSLTDWAYLADNSGTILAFLAPDTQTNITLIDNSTSAGSWVPLTTHQFSVVETNTTSIIAWPNIRYLLSAGTLTTVTLAPSTYIAGGDIFEIVGIGAGLFEIISDSGSSQVITIGTQVSTSSGYSRSIDASSSIRLIAHNGDALYALGAPQGNFTLV